MTPVARSGHAAAYDPIRDRMLVFGGTTAAPFYDSPNEVSSLALAGAPAWTEAMPGAQSPAGRWDHAAIYDPVRDRMFVLGGATWAYDGSLNPTNDTWQAPFSGTSGWSVHAPNGTPPQDRYGHTAIYDPVRDRVVIFGGKADFSDSFNDTWGLSLADPLTWSPITPGAMPTSRWDHAAIYDPIRDRMLIFGGYYVHGHFPLRSLSALSLGGSPAWTSLSPAGGPSARQGLSAIYDPPRDRMVVFGGMNGSTRFGDVWALSLSGEPVWTSLTPPGPAPAPRNGHSAIYDPVRDRMVVFGGSDGTSALGDIWALSLSGTPGWSLLDPGGPQPSPRYEHSAVYDALRDRMVVFGGWDGYNRYTDSWALAWGTTVGAPVLPRTPGASRVVRASPNPSSGPVSFEVELNGVGSARALAVYSVTGRLVWRAQLHAAGAGPQRVDWDGRGREGLRSPAGVYFAGLEGVPAARPVRFILMH
jgi:hypothetical protein